MKDNKEVLKYCPNYYNIVNFDYRDDDMISDKLIKIYKTYVFSVDTLNSESVQKLEELDHVLANYLSDYLFRSTMQKEIVHIKVKKDNNILQSLVDCIIKIFTNYEEYTTRKIYVSRWI